MGTFCEMEDIKDHVIVVDSISKRFSACGARVGCVVTKNPELQSALLKFCQSRLSVATIDQIGAAALYRVDPSFFRQCKEEYRIRRDTVISRLTITVPLPSSIDRDVTVSAYLDDMEVRRETINPKNTTSWKPSFSGEGIGRVKIYIDDEIYMEYIVDFDEGIHEIDSDYSQDFQ